MHGLVVADRMQCGREVCEGRRDGEARLVVVGPGGPDATFECDALGKTWAVTLRCVGKSESRLLPHADPARINIAVPPALAAVVGFISHFGWHDLWARTAPRGRPKPPPGRPNHPRGTISGRAPHTPKHTLTYDSYLPCAVVYLHSCMISCRCDNTARSAAAPLWCAPT